MPKAIHDGKLEKMFGKESRILWVDDVAGLIAGVQMNVLEFHIWGSLRQQPHLPGRMIFDIEPDEGLGFAAVKQAALDIRAFWKRLDCSRGRCCRSSRRQTGTRSRASAKTSPNYWPVQIRHASSPT